MRRRVVVAILSVTASAIVLFAVPLAIVLERFVDQNAILRLERRAVLAASAVPAQFGTDLDPIELPVAPPGVIIGLYDRDGSLVAGHGPPAADTVTSAALHNDITSIETDASFLVAAPVFSNEEIIGAIRAEEDNAVTERRAVTVAGLIAALATVVFAAGGGLAVLVARRLNRPVQTLTRAVVDLGRGDFAADPPPCGVAELDAAADALRSTAHRLQALVARERAFSADASHQLRTPLAGMRTAIETELAFPRTDPTTVLNECLLDIDRLDSTITRLLSLTRAIDPELTELNLAVVLDAAADDWQGRYATAGRPLRLDRPQPLPPGLGDPALLRTALDVLLDNALIHGAGETHISATSSQTAITISVSDQGPGFDTSTRTGPDQDTHGMGLPLAERLLGSMSARLTISRPGPRPTVSIIMRRPY